MALTEQKITALYERLSRDDDQIGDSNSISNQKLYLQHHALQRGYTNYAHYTDDGYTGGNFDRPGWKQLIADIEAGKVERVIVKDMSRVGRDYLQTGFYTEVFFRQHNVHFIAIANNVDSDDEASNEFTPFFNIMNEWYLRDQSRKVTAAYKVKGSSGKPITNSAIYGYINDPEDKNHWLVDEEAAAVVRRIFRMAVEGHGPYEISRTLTAEKVECPSYYLAARGRGQWKNRIEQIRPHDWYGETVRIILKKPEYAGHTVNFRFSKKSYKEKRVKNDPEDWMVFKNTHEAIVDQETWDLAQVVTKTRRRTDTTGVANPLTGLVFCADCGAKMYNRRSGHVNPNTGNQIMNDTYNCSNYSKSVERETRLCSSHNVSSRALRTLVLETIRKTSKYAIENEDEFRAKVQRESELRQANAVRELNRKVSKARQRSTELDTLIKKCYESFALGKMPEKRYEMLSAGYEQEQAELETVIAEGQAALDAYYEDSERVDQFIELARKYRDFDELTTPMLNEFVDKILVHAPERDEYGGRVQEIEIHLKFIGNFQVPEEEPTPEELAEDELVRKQRAEYRRKYAQRKERNRLIQEGVLTPETLYTRECPFCGKEFKAINPKQKYCNASCRTLYHRRKTLCEDEQDPSMIEDGTQDPVSDEKTA